MKHLSTYEGFSNDMKQVLIEPWSSLVSKGASMFKKKKLPGKIDTNILRDLLESDLEDVKFGYYKDPSDVMGQITFEDDKFISDSNNHPILSKETLSNEDVINIARSNRTIQRYRTGASKLPGSFSMPTEKQAKSKISDGVVAYIGDTNGHTRPAGIRSAIHTLKHINKERMTEYGIGYCLYDDDGHIGILFYSL